MPSSQATNVEVLPRRTAPLADTKNPQASAGTASTNTTIIITTGARFPHLARESASPSAAWSVSNSERPGQHGRRLPSGQIQAGTELPPPASRGDPGGSEGVNGGFTDRPVIVAEVVGRVW